MPVKFAFKEARLMTWLLCHQTFNLVSKCEDVMFAKAGTTTQQHAVLMAIKYINDPVKPTDVASWLDRNTNAITLIIDRMERDGLVKRVRDLRDRRSLRLIMTQKGEELLEQTTIPGWELVEEILSCLSEEELKTFNSIMEKVREKAFQYLYPGKSMEEIRTNEAEDMPRFLDRYNTEILRRNA